MPATGISIADIDRVLEGGFRLLRFPPALEARFEADTGAKRSRFLLFSGIITFGIFDLFIFRDRLQLSDIFETALIYRLGIITPLALASFVVLWTNPRPWIRESMEAVLTVLIAAGLLYLVTTSRSPMAMHAHYSMLLILVFPNIIQRVRFWYALSASAVVITMYAFGIPHIHLMQAPIVFGAVLLLTTTTMLSLIANWMLERDERREYLLGLRDKLRAQNLMVANEALSAISMLDPLTGLANRRRLEQFVDTLVGSGRDATKPIVFMMLDIDHFKRFNDHYGHQAGDDCLKMVAETLEQNLRAGSDLAVRLGGEEFLAVLPESTLFDGVQVAERIRAGVERHGTEHANSPTAPVVTVSIGVAVVKPDGRLSFSEATMAADEALYIAKQQGRNRVWPPLTGSEDDERHPVRHAV
ncbi:MAG: GGDEF domain-containing protein [Pseudolabrys sp.]|nr:GGDEF domain-containing protein [Pseudolabrys sp.]